MSTPAAVAVTIGFSILGVVGDYFLKLAADEEYSLRTLPFLVGFVVYASTAFGWVFVMKHLKLATIGVVYSVSMVLLLTDDRDGLLPRAARTLRGPRPGDGDRLADPAGPIRVGPVTRPRRPRAPAGAVTPRRRQCSARRSAAARRRRRWRSGRRGAPS